MFSYEFYLLVNEIKKTVEVSGFLESYDTSDLIHRMFESKSKLKIVDANANTVFDAIANDFIVFEQVKESR